MQLQLMYYLGICTAGCVRCLHFQVLILINRFHSSRKYIMMHYAIQIVSSCTLMLFRYFKYLICKILRQRGDLIENNNFGIIDKSKEFLATC